MNKIENDVLKVLSTLNIDGNNVVITGKLDRKLYLAVNKVLGGSAENGIVKQRHTFLMAILQTDWIT